MMSTIYNHKNDIKVVKKKKIIRNSGIFTYNIIKYPESCFLKQLCKYRAVDAKTWCFSSRHSLFHIPRRKKEQEGVCVIIARVTSITY